jgi:hypothetical protein
MIVVMIMMMIVVLRRGSSIYGNGVSHGVTVTVIVLSDDGVKAR